VSATWMTCANVDSIQAEHGSPWCDYRDGLSKPVLLGQLRRFGGSAKVQASIHVLDCDASSGRNMSSAL
jgi:hypothetical protein